MRKLAAAIVALLTAGLASVHAEPQSVIDDFKNPQYLFTMAARSGTHAEHTLKLTGVPLVVYFSDRPSRIAGHMDLQSFLKMWDEGADNFKDDPPSAELAIFNESGIKHAVLILSKPAIDGDDISFDVVVVKEKIPATFERSTLFIDNFRTVGGRR